MKKFFLSACFVLAGFVATANAQLFTSEPTRKASEKMSQGDRAGALAILDKAIEKRQDLLEAYQMRAILRTMTGDVDGAIADYSAALEVYPNVARLYEWRAKMRAFKRDHAGALKDLDAAIANGLKSERVYTDRASVKHDMGDVAGAVADFQAALAVNPDFASAHNGLASLLDRNGDLDGAIIHLQRFIDRYEGARGGKLPTVKGETSARSGVSIKRDTKEKDGTQVFMEGGEFTTTFKANSPEEVERQQARYEQLMNLSFAYANLGKMYAKKDNLDKALEYYGKGLSIRKDDSYILNLRSEALIRKGDLQGAIADLTVSVGGGRGMADRHLHKGLLLVLQGKDAEAEKEFALHRQMFPGVSSAYMDRRIEEARRLRSRQPQQ